jgi:L-lysine 6-transaminase
MVRADKMLQIIEEDGLVEHVRITGEYLLERTQQIAATHPEKMTNVRGRGFMVAFDLPNGPSVNKFINLSLDQNVIFLGCGERSIRFRPGLITQKSHIDEAFAVLDTVVGQL